ncbi:toprim domain-containing protein [Areca yellow leaf disease phytoplasma]|uniref:toprim domain-containing protein n=1 Tax=Areca yellow leaf disease phytoplasma TaxID=927614 RepID=UPI0035B52259
MHEGFLMLWHLSKAQIQKRSCYHGNQTYFGSCQTIKKLTDKIIIAYDGDKAGKTATLEIGTFLQKKPLQSPNSRFSQ